VKKESYRTETAEEKQKDDITLRWVELINATARLQSKLIFSNDGISVSFRYFYEKFYAFFYATRFYVDEGVRNETDEFLKTKGKSIPLFIELSKKYAQECYKKGLFLEPEDIAEEGFD